MHAAEEVRAGRFDCLAALSDVELERVNDKLEGWKKTDREYHQRAEKRARLRAKPTPVDITGRQVYLQTDGLLSDAEARERNLVVAHLEDQAWSTCLSEADDKPQKHRNQRLRTNLTPDPKLNKAPETRYPFLFVLQDATVFVVQSAANPPVPVLWHATLAGGSVVDARFAKSGVGACLTYKPALSRQRILWMTVAFAENHTELATGLMRRQELGWGFISGQGFQFLARIGFLKCVTAPIFENIESQDGSWWQTVEMAVSGECGALFGEGRQRCEQSNPLVLGT